MASVDTFSLSLLMVNIAGLPAEYFVKVPLLPPSLPHHCPCDTYLVCTFKQGQLMVAS